MIEKMKLNERKKNNQDLHVLWPAGNKGWRFSIRPRSRITTFQKEKKRKEKKRKEKRKKKKEKRKRRRKTKTCMRLRCNIGLSFATASLQILLFFLENDLSNLEY
jgi:hypothetical protein